MIPLDADGGLRPQRAAGKHRQPHALLDALGAKRDGRFEKLLEADGQPQELAVAEGSAPKSHGGSRSPVQTAALLMRSLPLNAERDASNAAPEIDDPKQEEMIFAGSGSEVAWQAGQMEEARIPAPSGKAVALQAVVHGHKQPNLLRNHAARDERQMQPVDESDINHEAGAQPVAKHVALTPVVEPRDVRPLALAPQILAQPQKGEARLPAQKAGDAEPADARAKDFRKDKTLSGETFRADVKLEKVVKGPALANGSPDRVVSVSREYGVMYGVSNVSPSGIKSVGFGKAENESARKPAPDMHPPDEHAPVEAPAAPASIATEASSALQLAALLAQSFTQSERQSAHDPHAESEELAEIPQGGKQVNADVGKNETLPARGDRETKSDVEPKASVESSLRATAEKHAPTIESSQAGNAQKPEAAIAATGLQKVTIAAVALETHLSPVAPPLIMTEPVSRPESTSRARPVAAAAELPAEAAMKPLQILKVKLDSDVAGPVNATLRLRHNQLAVQLETRDDVVAGKLKEDAAALALDLRGAGYAVDQVTVRSMEPEQQPAAQEQRQAGGGSSASESASGQSGRQQGHARDDHEVKGNEQVSRVSHDRAGGVYL